jgi:hypothetical protein
MLQQFLSVALPIMITFVATIWIAAWAQNKRLDDIIARLGRIESKLEDHQDRIVRLEERNPPLLRR